MWIIEGHSEAAKDSASNQSADVGAGKEPFCVFLRKDGYRSAQNIRSKLQALNTTCERFRPATGPETEVAIVLRADSSARFALTKGAANAKPPAPESIKHWPLIGVRLGIVICAATRGTLPRTSKGKRCPAHRA